MASRSSLTSSSHGNDRMCCCPHDERHEQQRQQAQYLPTTSADALDEEVQAFEDQLHVSCTQLSSAMRVFPELSVLSLSSLALARSILLCDENGTARTTKDGEGWHGAGLDSKASVFFEKVLLPIIPPEMRGFCEAQPPCRESSQSLMDCFLAEVVRTLDNRSHVQSETTSSNLESAQEVWLDTAGLLVRRCVETFFKRKAYRMDGDPEKMAIEKLDFTKLLGSAAASGSCSRIEVCGADCKHVCESPLQSARETPQLTRSSPSSSLLDLTLALYFANVHRMPYFFEVVVCTPETTVSEILQFIRCWRTFANYRDALGNPYALPTDADASLSVNLSRPSYPKDNAYGSVAELPSSSQSLPAKSHTRAPAPLLFAMVGTSALSLEVATVLANVLPQCSTNGLWQRTASAHRQSELLRIFPSLLMLSWTDGVRNARRERICSATTSHLSVKSESETTYFPLGKGPAGQCHHHLTELGTAIHLEWAALSPLVLTILPAIQRQHTLCNLLGVYTHPLWSNDTQMALTVATTAGHSLPPAGPLHSSRDRAAGAVHCEQYVRCTLDDVCGVLTKYADDSSYLASIAGAHEERTLLVQLDLDSDSLSEPVSATLLSLLLFGRVSSSGGMRPVLAVRPSQWFLLSFHGDAATAGKVTLHGAPPSGARTGGCTGQLLSVFSEPVQALRRELLSTHLVPLPWDLTPSSSNAISPRAARTWGALRIEHDQASLFAACVLVSAVYACSTNIADTLSLSDAWELAATCAPDGLLRVPWRAVSGIISSSAHPTGPESPPPVTSAVNSDDCVSSAALVLLIHEVIRACRACTSLASAPLSVFCGGARDAVGATARCLDDTAAEDKVHSLDDADVIGVQRCFLGLRSSFGAMLARRPNTASPANALRCSVDVAVMEIARCALVARSASVCCPPVGVASTGVTPCSRLLPTDMEAEQFAAVAAAAVGLECGLASVATDHQLANFARDRLKLLDLIAFRGGFGTALRSALAKLHGSGGLSCRGSLSRDSSWMEQLLSVYALYWKSSGLFDANVPQTSAAATRASPAVMAKTAPCEFPPPPSVEKLGHVAAFYCSHVQQGDAALTLLSKRAVFAPDDSRQRSRSDDGTLTVRRTLDLDAAPPFTLSSYLVRMLALVQRRLLAGEPVVVMGAVGCGKTAFAYSFASMCGVPAAVMRYSESMTHDAFCDAVEAKLHELSVVVEQLEHWKRCVGQQSHEGDAKSVLDVTNRNRKGTPSTGAEPQTHDVATSSSMFPTCLLLLDDVSRTAYSSHTLERLLSGRCLRGHRVPDGVRFLCTVAAQAVQESDDAVCRTGAAAPPASALSYATIHLRSPCTVRVSEAYMAAARVPLPPPDIPQPTADGLVSTEWLIAHANATWLCETRLWRLQEDTVQENNRRAPHGQPCTLLPSPSCESTPPAGTVVHEAADNTVERPRSDGGVSTPEMENEAYLIAETLARLVSLQRTEELARQHTRRESAAESSSPTTPAASPARQGSTALHSLRHMQRWLDAFNFLAGAVARYMPQESPASRLGAALYGATRMSYCLRLPDTDRRRAAAQVARSAGSVALGAYRATFKRLLRRLCQCPEDVYASEGMAELYVVLLGTLCSPSGSGNVFVLGPPGVGKTLPLLSLQWAASAHRSGREPNEERGHPPAIGRGELTHHHLALRPMVRVAVQCGPETSVEDIVQAARRVARLRHSKAVCALLVLEVLGSQEDPNWAMTMAAISLTADKGAYLPECGEWRRLPVVCFSSTAVDVSVMDRFTVVQTLTPTVDDLCGIAVKLAPCTAGPHPAAPSTGRGGAAQRVHHGEQRFAVFDWSVVFPALLGWMRGAGHAECTPPARGAHHLDRALVTPLVSYRDLCSVVRTMELFHAVPRIPSMRLSHHTAVFSHATFAAFIVSLGVVGGNGAWLGRLLHYSCLGLRVPPPQSSGSAEESPCAADGAAAAEVVRTMPPVPAAWTLLRHSAGGGIAVCPFCRALCIHGGLARATEFQPVTPALSSADRAHSTTTSSGSSSGQIGAEKTVRGVEEEEANRRPVYCNFMRNVTVFERTLLRATLHWPVGFPTEEGADSTDTDNHRQGEPELIVDGTLNKAGGTVAQRRPFRHLLGVCPPARVPHALAFLGLGALATDAAAAAAAPRHASSLPQPPALPQQQVQTVVGRLDTHSSDRMDEDARKAKAAVRRGETLVLVDAPHMYGYLSSVLRQHDRRVGAADCVELSDRGRTERVAVHKNFRLIAFTTEGGYAEMSHQVRGWFTRFVASDALLWDASHLAVAPHGHHALRSPDSSRRESSSADRRRLADRLSYLAPGLTLDTVRALLLLNRTQCGVDTEVSAEEESRRYTPWMRNILRAVISPVRLLQLERDEGRGDTVAELSHALGEVLWGADERSAPTVATESPTHTARCSHNDSVFDCKDDLCGAYMWYLQHCSATALSVSPLSASTMAFPCSQARHAIVFTAQQPRLSSGRSYTLKLWQAWEMACKAAARAGLAGSASISSLSGFEHAAAELVRTGDEAGVVSGRSALRRAVNLTALSNTALRELLRAEEETLRESRQGGILPLVFYVFDSPAVSGHRSASSPPLYRSSGPARATGDWLGPTHPFHAPCLSWQLQRFTAVFAQSALSCDARVRVAVVVVLDPALLALPPPRAAGSASASLPTVVSSGEHAAPNRLHSDWLAEDTERLQWTYPGPDWAVFHVDEVYRCECEDGLAAFSEEVDGTLCALLPHSSVTHRTQQQQQPQQRKKKNSSELPAECSDGLVPTRVHAALARARHAPPQALLFTLADVLRKGTCSPVHMVAQYPRLVQFTLLSNAPALARELSAAPTDAAEVTAWADGIALLFSPAEKRAPTAVDRSPLPRGFSAGPCDECARLTACPLGQVCVGFMQAFCAYQLEKWSGPRRQAARCGRQPSTAPAGKHGEYHGTAHSCNEPTGVVPEAFDVEKLLAPVRDSGVRDSDCTLRARVLRKTERVVLNLAIHVLTLLFPSPQALHAAIAVCERSAAPPAPSILSSPGPAVGPMPEDCAVAREGTSRRCTRHSQTPARKDEGNAHGGEWVCPLVRFFLHSSGPGGSPVPIDPVSSLAFSFSLTGEEVRQRNPFFCHRPRRSAAVAFGARHTLVPRLPFSFLIYRLVAVAEEQESLRAARGAAASAETPSGEKNGAHAAERAVPSPVGSLGSWADNIDMQCATFLSDYAHDALLYFLESHDVLPEGGLSTDTLWCLCAAINLHTHGTVSGGPPSAFSCATHGSPPERGAVVSSLFSATSRRLCRLFQEEPAWLLSTFRWSLQVAHECADSVSRTRALVEHSAELDCSTCTGCRSGAVAVLVSDRVLAAFATEHDLFRRIVLPCAERKAHLPLPRCFSVEGDGSAAADDLGRIVGPLQSSSLYDEWGASAEAGELCRPSPALLVWLRAHLSDDREALWLVDTLLLSYAMFSEESMPPAPSHDHADDEAPAWGTPSVEYSPGTLYTEGVSTRRSLVCSLVTAAGEGPQQLCKWLCWQLRSPLRAEELHSAPPDPALPKLRHKAWIAHVVAPFIVAHLSIRQPELWKAQLLDWVLFSVVEDYAATTDDNPSSCSPALVELLVKEAADNWVVQAEERDQQHAMSLPLAALAPALRERASTRLAVIAVSSLVNALRSLGARHPPGRRAQLTDPMPVSATVRHVRGLLWDLCVRAWDERRRDRASAYYSLSVCAAVAVLQVELECLREELLSLSPSRIATGLSANVNGLARRLAQLHAEWNSYLGELLPAPQRAAVQRGEDPTQLCNATLFLALRVLSNGGLDLQRALAPFAALLHVLAPSLRSSTAELVEFNDSRDDTASRLVASRIALNPVLSALAHSTGPKSSLYAVLSDGFVCGRTPHDAPALEELSPATRSALARCVAFFCQGQRAAAAAGGDELSDTGTATPSATSAYDRLCGSFHYFEATARALMPPAWHDEEAQRCLVASMLMFLAAAAEEEGAFVAQVLSGTVILHMKFSEISSSLPPLMNATEERASTMVRMVRAVMALVYTLSGTSPPLRLLSANGIPLLRDQGDRDVVERVLLSLLPSCPRCQAPFSLFVGCAALKCHCGAEFCAWCFHDFSDAHQHVPTCRLSENKGSLYTTIDAWKLVYVREIFSARLEKLLVSQSFACVIGGRLVQFCKPLPADEERLLRTLASSAAGRSFLRRGAYKMIVESFLLADRVSGAALDLKRLDGCVGLGAVELGAGSCLESCVVELRDAAERMCRAFVARSDPSSPGTLIAALKTLLGCLSVRRVGWAEAALTPLALGPAALAVEELVRAVDTAVNASEALHTAQDIVMWGPGFRRAVSAACAGQTPGAALPYLFQLFPAHCSAAGEADEDGREEGESGSELSQEAAALERVNLLRSSLSRSAATELQTVLEFAWDARRVVRAAFASMRAVRQEKLSFLAERHPQLFPSERVHAFIECSRALLEHLSRADNQCHAGQDFAIADVTTAADIPLDECLSLDERGLLNVLFTGTDSTANTRAAHVGYGNSEDGQNTILKSFHARCESVWAAGQNTPRRTDAALLLSADTDLIQYDFTLAQRLCAVFGLRNEAARSRYLLPTVSCSSSLALSSALVCSDTAAAPSTCAAAHHAVALRMVLRGIACSPGVAGRTTLPVVLPELTLETSGVLGITREVILWVQKWVCAAQTQSRDATATDDETAARRNDPHGARGVSLVEEDFTVASRAKGFSRVPDQPLSLTGSRVAEAQWPQRVAEQARQLLLPCAARLDALHGLFSFLGAYAKYASAFYDCPAREDALLAAAAGEAVPSGAGLPSSLEHDDVSAEPRPPPAYESVPRPCLTQEQHTAQQTLVRAGADPRDAAMLLVLTYAVPRTQQMVGEPVNGGGERPQAAPHAADEARARSSSNLAAGSDYSLPQLLVCCVSLKLTALLCDVLGILPKQRLSDTVSSVFAADCPEVVELIVSITGTEAASSTLATTVESMQERASLSI